MNTEDRNFSILSSSNQPPMLIRTNQGRVLTLDLVKDARFKTPRSTEMSTGISYPGPMTPGAPGRAQPKAFLNRHAIRVLNDARRGGGASAWYVDADHMLLDPVEYTADFDEKRPFADGGMPGDPWPTWPEFTELPMNVQDADMVCQKVYPHHVRADVIRWAFNKDFV